MDKPTYKPLNMEGIKHKKSVLISTKEALEDVIPIEWETDVLNGKKQVMLVKND